MSVELTVVPLEPQEEEIKFHRPLINSEMISLQELLHSDRLRGLFAEGERYQLAVISRESVRWYSRDAQSSLKIVTVTRVFAASLPDVADEPHPERLCYNGGTLSLRQ